MKRYFQYIVSAVAIMLPMVACESEPVEVLQPEADYAFVELSSPTTAVEVAGGTKTIYVASNRTELNVEKSCWWGNGNTFSGDFLSSGGFNPVLREANSSAVFLLECE